MMDTPSEIEGKSAGDVHEVTLRSFLGNEEEIRKLLEQHGISYEEPGPGTYTDEGIVVEVGLNERLEFVYRGEEAELVIKELYSEDLLKDITELKEY